MRSVEFFPEKDLIYLFNQGKYYRAYEVFGAHAQELNGVQGVSFVVWAPDVPSVHVIGDFNGWNEEDSPLWPFGSTGVWTGFIPEIEEGCKYKYLIRTRDGNKLYKADPFAFEAELRPATASRFTRLSYEWNDADWVRARADSDVFASPKNIYEVHAGSWKRHPYCVTEDESLYTYTELADSLLPYVKEMGYTHIELMPLMEHPFDGSWGYQITGYFAATSRYGRPDELMYFIDKAHELGIGVILDWVPGHFCRDEHGLVRFTGRNLFECGEHPVWGTLKFDYAKAEVRSFLISSALFWIDRFHIDGIRVDGVSSMLYLNFGVDNEEQKIFNKNGTEENYDAVAFLQEFNSVIGMNCPGVFTVAEESTAWPLVTYPPSDGGLGFHYKWNMGWMNDTLQYCKTDFPFRSGCHSLLTFSMVYAFNENYILPLSHDEVVHGKSSLIGRMPGDYWRQFAGLRALALYQIAHPGGKLSFMGNEFAPYIEWRYYEELEWFMPREFESHRRQQDYIKALNHVYLKERALWADDRSWNGFTWIDAGNAGQSIIVFSRNDDASGESIITLINFGVFAYKDYRVGVPFKGTYTEIFNSDSAEFGGNNDLNPEPLKTEGSPFHGHPYSISINVPSLGGVMLKIKKQ